MPERYPWNSTEEFVAMFPTVDDYLRWHQQAGHVCCMCPAQSPPLPCCNDGHDEAQRLQAEFAQIVGGEAHDA